MDNQPQTTQTPLTFDESTFEPLTTSAKPAANPSVTPVNMTAPKPSGGSPPSARPSAPVTFDESTFEPLPKTGTTQNTSQSTPPSSSLWDRITNTVFHPLSASTDYDPNTPGEQDKARIYDHAIDDFHKGNYFQAAKDLLDLNDPTKNAARAEQIRQTRQAAIGGVKSVGQTVKSLSNVVNTVGSLGINKLLEPKAVTQENAKIDQALTPSNEDQQAGANAETVMEFMMGDAALKALSVADRLSEVSKIGKFMAAHPRISNVIVDALKGGTVGGGVGAVHGGTEGAVQGAGYGVAGGVFSGIVEPTHAFNPETGTVEPVEKAVNESVGKSGLPEGEPIPYSADEAQTAIHENIQNAFSQASRNAGMPVEDFGEERIASDYSTRDVASDLGDKIKTRASAAYKTLDEASGGRWQRFDDSVSNLRDKADELAGIDDEKAEQFSRKADGIENERDAMVKQLVKDGKIAEGLGEQASKDWSQQKALERVDKVLKQNIRPSGFDKPETITNPQTLEKSLQRLYDDPRQYLQRAVGQGNADILMETVRIQNDFIDNYYKLSTTGQNALRGIVRKNAVPTPSIFDKGKVSIDWKSTLKDFENTPVADRNRMFGNDTGLARHFLQRQATRQAWIQGAKTAGKIAGIGGTAEEIIRRLFFSDNTRQSLY